MGVDIDSLKKDFIDIRKINKVTSLIDKSVKLSITRETIIEELKKVKRDFKLYYTIYDRMDGILKKYDENSDFIEKLGDDNYDKINKLISQSNDLRIRDIYQEIFNSGVDDNAQDEPEQNYQNEGDQAQMVVQAEMLDKKEYYDKREQDLQKVHQISGKLKDMTQNMALGLDSQREKLDNVELNVEKAHDNALNAKKEIDEANKIAKKNTKRLCCLIFIILVAIGGIAAIVLSLIL